jgi:hypothetical protein
MSQDVVRAFYYQLTSQQLASDGFFVGVGGRIYEREAPAMENTPLAIFQLISAPFEQTFNGSTLKDYLFQVDIYNRKQDGMAALGGIQTKLFTLMQNSTPPISNHGAARIECTNDGIRSVEGEYLRVITEFRLRTGATV